MPTPRKTLEDHKLMNTKPEYSEDPSFTSGRPKLPKGMSPIAEEEWKRLVPKLTKRKQLTKADASALEIYCRVFARWRKVADMAEQNPLSEIVWYGKDGEPHTKQEESPASKIAARLESQLRAYLIQFSATPASRKLTKPDKEQKDPVPKTDAALLSREAATPALADEGDPDLSLIDENVV
jgi:P27 family predicted phage terminase small subunit